MAVSRAMRRLLQVLEIEEEQSRAAMETARAQLRRLEQALVHGRERERRGRRLVQVSASSGEVADRMAGLEETRTAVRLTAALQPRIAEAASLVEQRQREFLDKRVERRQTETLIDEAEAQQNLDAARRAQRDLDDWFLNQRFAPGTKQQAVTLGNGHDSAESSEPTGES